MRPFPVRACLVAAGLLLFTVTVRAQSWGQVAGRVTTSGNEPVPGATILVERTGFGTVADADGHFSMRIPTGRYRLRVTGAALADEPTDYGPQRAALSGDVERVILDRARLMTCRDVGPRPAS